MQFGLDSCPMVSSCSTLVPNDCAGSSSPKLGRPQHWLPTPFVIVLGRAGQHQKPCLVKEGFLYPFDAKGWAMLPLNHLWSAYESLMNLWTTWEQAWFSTPYEPPLNCTWTPYEPLNHPWTSMVFNPLWTIFELHMDPIWTSAPPMNKHGFQPPMNHLWTAHEPHMNLWNTHEQAWFLALFQKGVSAEDQPGWVQLWACNRSWNQPDPGLNSS
jgi:hypothetical protein